MICDISSGGLEVRRPFFTQGQAEQFRGIETDQSLPGYRVRGGVSGGDLRRRDGPVTSRKRASSY